MWVKCFAHNPPDLCSIVYQSRRVYTVLEVKSRNKEVSTVLFLTREDGQGLVEYALIILLVASCRPGHSGSSSKTTPENASIENKEREYPSVFQILEIAE